VIVSLAADAVVLGGAVAFVGGTGSGLVMLYAIVLVSAGILLGPAAAAGFTLGCVALSLLQLLSEELGYPPVLLHRPDLGDRLPILAVSLAGLLSIGYLSATYAGRLHELIAEKGDQVEAARSRGRLSRSFVERAVGDVLGPLRSLEEVAAELDDRWEDLDSPDRRRLAARLRMGVTAVDGEISQLADLDALEGAGERRPQPILLRRVVEDCIIALGPKLAYYIVDFDMPPLRVVADPRALRRIVFNLLENVVEHTPAGTQVHITAVTTAGFAVLAVTDDGPGIPPKTAEGVFDPPGSKRNATMGLPLVAQLAEAMNAEIRHEPGPHGGARFLVRLRQAPSAALATDEDPITAEQG
jgi:signal transduction histidine kinase